VILADTKFEFGLDSAGQLTVGDEVLTPDSSRYWPLEGYEIGRGQPSFDKQFVRDWATASGWDKSEPAPALPEDVVAGTTARYAEAYELITGEPLSAWLERTGGSI
jgi:phosphoribosylaminoimidazole-succinocarboxamide synthase